MTGTGVVLAIAGGGAIITGRWLEGRFLDDPYDDAVYGGCSRTQACWEDKRADAIAADARTANAAYLSGYALTGVGLGLVGIDLLVAHDRSGGAVRGIRLRGRF